MSEAAIDTATATLREYAQLADEKAYHEEELLKVKARQAELEPQVLAHFQRAGISRVTIDDRTLHLRRELWAGREDGVTSEQAIAALRAAGLEDFAEPKINTQQLSAWCRERDRDGEQLPPSFAGIIKVSETFKIGSRRS